MENGSEYKGSKKHGTESSTPHREKNTALYH